VVVAAALTAGTAAAETRIKCASTTSTQNSGLFDYLLPIFEKKTGIKVDVVAVGTGASIEIGKRGDADVVMVHAKELELKAVEEGAFVNRHDLMYNDFVIIGPTDDPLKIKGMKSAVEAFKKIGAQDKVPFASRGDKSGTHTMELGLWKKAGLDPKGQKWYLEVGQGMEKTQRIANEKRAYRPGHLVGHQRQGQTGNGGGAGRRPRPVQSIRGDGGESRKAPAGEI
jgi:tungstate transport system substrate-binding protein